MDVTSTPIQPCEQIVGNIKAKNMTINNSNVAKLDVDIGKTTTSMVTTNIANIKVLKEFSHLQLFTMSLQNLDLDAQEYIFLCQQVLSSLKMTLADVANFLSQPIVAHCIYSVDGNKSTFQVDEKVSTTHDPFQPCSLGVHVKEVQIFLINLQDD